MQIPNVAGVADLKGIKLQEQAYLAAARARGDGQAAPFINGCPEARPSSLQRQLCEVACAGEKLTQRQPLQSENDKFWAVVEPVALQRPLPGDKAQTFGPQLLTSQARRKMLLRSHNTRSAMLCGVSNVLCGNWLRVKPFRWNGVAAIPEANS